MKISAKNKIRYILGSLSVLVALLFVFSIFATIPVLGATLHNIVNTQTNEVNDEVNDDENDNDNDEDDNDDENDVIVTSPPTVSYRIGDGAVLQLTAQQRTQAASNAGLTVVIPCADLFNATTQAFVNRSINVSLTQQGRTTHTDTATQNFNGDRDLRLTVTDLDDVSFTINFTMSHGNLLWEYTNDNVCSQVCVMCSTAVSSMPHIWREGNVVQEGSCTHARIFHEDCTRCNTRQLRTIPAGNHVEERTVIQEATCVLPEIIMYTCTTSGCNHYRRVENAALGHDFDTHDSDVAPTCLTPGRRSRDCRRCGYSQNQVEVPPLGHNFEIVLDPTCTVPGRQRCQACFIEEEIDATGEHEWDEGVVTREATIDQQGQLRKTCLTCNSVNIVPIEYEGTVDPGGNTSPFRVFMWIFVFTILLGSAGVAVYLYMVKDGQLAMFKKKKSNATNNAPKSNVAKNNTTKNDVSNNKVFPKDPWED